MGKRILTVAFCAVVMVLGVLPTSSFADSTGGAVMPGVLAYWSSSTTYALSSVHLTNISGAEVSVEVKWYDYAGNNSTSYCNVYSGSLTSSADALIASGTGSFTLPAGATRYVKFYAPNVNKSFNGHAVIKWSSTNDNIRKALIGVGRGISISVSGSRQHAFMLPVNNNEPF